ncbi:GFA family protein [Marinobacter sp. ANT_B65]|uniref:GFA family protein n=1 Tax=Marinobacter sp. ANT_B65 TaxID=2039467 RepID=UPI001D0D0088|nr:GFA family protein [Marinobacter sp. ANT_B65]
MKFYESSPGEHKGFCSNCGSSLYIRFDAALEVYGLPLGTLDTDPGVKAERHVFVGSKAPLRSALRPLFKHYYRSRYVEIIGLFDCSVFFAVWRFFYCGSN